MKNFLSLLCWIWLLSAFGALPLAAQKGTATVWKAIPGSDSPKCKGCFEALKAGNYDLKWDTEGNPVWYSLRLGHLPKLIKKKKDRVILHHYNYIQADSCQAPPPVQSLSLDRNAIRVQLYQQFDRLYWNNHDEQHIRLYEQALRKWETTTRSEKDTEPLQRIQKTVKSQSDLAYESIRQIILADAQGEYEAYVAALPLANLSEKQADQREKRLADALGVLQKKLKKERKKYKKERKIFRKFLKNKAKGEYAKGRYLWTITLPKPTAAPSLEDRFSLEFIYKKQACATLAFEQFPAEYPDTLPIVDLSICRPLDRMDYFFKRSKPAPPKGVIRYRPQSPKPSIADFTIVFEKDKSEYSLDDIAPIARFLADSNKVIIRARVSAFASIEGDSTRNVELMEERASILINLLNTANDDSIESEVLTAENWGLFRQQLDSVFTYRSTEYPDVRNQSAAEVKALLEDPEVEATFAALLADQRYASLKLQVVDRMTPELKAEKIDTDLKKLLNYIRNGDVSDDQRNQLYRRIAGMRRYVRTGIRKNVLPDSLGQFQELFDVNTDFLALTDFYDLKQEMKRGLEPVYQDPETIVLRAYETTYRLLESAALKKQKKRYKSMLNHALQVQWFAYRLMLRKGLPAENYCELSYPNRKPFWRLLMNRMYFSGKPGQELVDSTSCAPIRISVAKAAFGDSQNDFYYNVAKSNVFDSDDPESNVFYEFDFFTYLSTNVRYWREKEPRFYDEEIGALRMLKDFKKLKSIRKDLCLQDFSRLELSLHYKSIYYFSHAAAWDSRGRLSSQALPSARAIRDHYVDRSPFDDTRLFVHRYQMALYPDLYDKQVWYHARDLLQEAFEAGSRDAELVRSHYRLRIILEPQGGNILEEAQTVLDSEEWCLLFQEVRHLLSRAEIEQVAAFCGQCN